MTKNPVVLGVILIGIIGIIVLLARPSLPERSGSDGGRLFAELDTSAVDQISIDADEDVELLREEGGWVVASQEGFAADPDGVDRLLSEIHKLSADDVVSRRPEKHEKFEVDSAQAIGVVVGSGGETVAHFYIGKSSQDYSSNYVRDASRDEVFLQHSSVRNQFDRRGRSWKDLTVFTLEYEDMRRLEVIRGDEKLVFSYEGAEEWIIQEPPGYIPAGPYVIAMARVLTRLTAIEIPPAEEWDSAGFDEPVATVTVTMAAGDSHQLVLGQDRPDSPGKYVHRGEDEVLYVVPSSRVLNFTRPTEELIVPAPPDTSDADDETALPDSSAGES